MKSGRDEAARGSAIPSTRFSPSKHACFDLPFRKLIAHNAFPDSLSYRLGLKRGTSRVYGYLSLARHVRLCDHFESPCQPPSEGLGIGPEGADRRVDNLARLQLTDVARSIPVRSAISVRLNPCRSHSRRGPPRPRSIPDLRQAGIPVDRLRCLGPVRPDTGGLALGSTRSTALAAPGSARRH